MNIRLIEVGEREQWNELVAAHPYGGVEQSYEWGELQTQIPGRPAFFVFGVFEGATLRGGMMVVRQVMGLGKTWLWCPRGPLLPESGADEVWEELLRGVRALAKEGGDVFLRIEPGVPMEKPFAPEGKVAREHYLPTDTLALDLAESEAAILAQMSQNGRANIKKAEKHGVEVQHVSVADLPLFYDLLTDTADRDEFSVHGKSFYEDFLKVLGKRVHFYLAFVDGGKEGGAGLRPVAGILVTYFGGTATYYFGASSSAHRESRASYLLQWTAILDAKKAGMKVYDFLGVAPEGSSGHALEGVTQFKTRFGGKRVSYHAAQVVVFRPLWWFFYRLAKRLKQSRGRDL